MHRRRSLIVLCIGVVLVFGSIVFRVAGVPALVRFPLNVDETTRYTGTAITYVDRATLLPLATPTREPLEISRHVKTVSGDFNHAVVDETVTVKTGGTTSVETYQYVLDRRTMKMLADPRMYAFGDPANTMHGAGAYRVTFPMGTHASGSYRAFIPEEDATSQLHLAEGPHVHGDAHVKVIDFTSHLDAPVAPYYREHLAKEMGLPMAVTAAQLEPLLRAAGIDVNRALADVGPKLLPSESALVNTTLAKPVPLRYYFLSNGLISIEPRTGALIDVHTQQQGLSVAPDLRGAAVLQPLLAKYAAIPSVKALSDGLAKLSKRPPQVAVSYRYTQTVPSSLAAAGDARDNARTMNLVGFRVPLAVALLGLLLIGLGAFGWWRGRAAARRQRGPGEPPIPEEAIPAAAEASPQPIPLDVPPTPRVGV